MRIERHGPVERLTPRVERFLREYLGGVNQDEVQSHQQRRIDYVCRNGLVAVEIKTLEGDASERMENLVVELREDPEWPAFFGSWSAASVLKHLSDPEAVKLRLLNRSGRAIVNHLKSANKQLAAHTSTFPRRNVVRVVILINEDHDIYTPHLVGHILWHAVRKHENGKLMLGNIDAVVYFTERHATKIVDKIAFPILDIDGAGIVEAPWKRHVIASCLDRWREFSASELHRMEPTFSRFATIEPIPDQMARHQAWALVYRRKPYLRGVSEARLRDVWDELLVMSLLQMMEGSPVPHDHAETMIIMEKQAHLYQELAHRGLPITSFPFESLRVIEAGRRLHLSEHVIGWLARLRRAPVSGEGHGDA